MTEPEPLVGGNWTAEVLRIGDEVHRSHHYDHIARVLKWLEDAGYPYAPRYLGRDDAGRDVLSFIAGTTTDHPSQRDEGAYAAGGRMLRELHDLTAGTELAESAECLIHGDAGPFNTIFNDGLPVAFIDWDSCGPGRRIDDLAYLAWTWCVLAQGNVPIEAQAERLARLRDGYGLDTNVDLLAAMLDRQDALAAVWTSLLNREGETEAFYAHQRRAIQWATDDGALIRTHRDTFERALAR